MPRHQVHPTYPQNEKERRYYISITARQAGFEDGLGFSDIIGYLQPEEHMRMSRVHMQEGSSSLLSHQILGSGLCSHVFLSCFTFHKDMYG